MKLTTIIIPAIEMTQEESDALRRSRRDFGSADKADIGGKRIRHWNTDDGNNEILLEGEDTYRVVIIRK